MRGRTTARTTAGTGTVAAATLVVAALVLTGCTVHDDDAPTTPHRTSAAAGARTTDVSHSFAVLQRTFEASDALPKDSTASDDTVVPNSQRRVGTVDGTTYWVAVGQEGGACLIAADDPDSVENWTVCGGNAADGSFVGRASVVISMLDEHGHQTSLVSDGYTDTGSDALHEIAPNVWAS
jgi:hypothetical protein